MSEKDFLASRVFYAGISIVRGFFLIGERSFIWFENSNDRSCIESSRRGFLFPQRMYLHALLSLQPNGLANKKYHAGRQRCELLRCRNIATEGVSSMVIEETRISRFVAAVEDQPIVVGLDTQKKICLVALFS